MREHYPELLKLTGKVVQAGQHAWKVRHADVLEDQASTRLALLLDLEGDSEIISVRLLFPSETHLVERDPRDTTWILEALKKIIEGGRLRQNGIYSIGSAS